MNSKRRYCQFDFKSVVINKRTGTKIRSWWITLFWILISLSLINRMIQISYLNDDPSYLIGMVIGYMIPIWIILGLATYHGYYSSGTKTLWWTQLWNGLWLTSTAASTLIYFYKGAIVLFIVNLVTTLSILLFIVWNSRLILLNYIISQKITTPDELQSPDGLVSDSQELLPKN